MSREKKKKTEASQPVQQPRPKIRREPLPIKIKAQHHLSSLLAEGSATDLTLAAFEHKPIKQIGTADADVPAAKPPHRARSDRPSRASSRKASGISDGIPDGIPSGIPSDTEANLVNQLPSSDISRLDNTQAPQTKTLYVHLDATRTPNEQKLYSNLLRDLRRRSSELEPVYGKNTGRYGYTELLRLTGIRSRTTLRVAIEGLLIKEDIELVQRTKMGTIYRVREPKEILEVRQAKSVLIDPGTKWIYSKEGHPVDWRLYLKRITGEPRTLSLVADEVAKKVSGIPDGIPDGIPGKTTDGIPDGIPESDTPVYQNLIHLNTKYINKPVGLIEPNSSSNNAKTDDDDEKTPRQPPVHRSAVVNLYETYTGNKWKPSDEMAYTSVANLLLEVIEAGILSSVLRCPTRVHSFSYCLGAILEFEDFLPPGYLLYLRKRFRDRSRRTRLVSPGSSQPSSEEKKREK